MSDGPRRLTEPVLFRRIFQGLYGLLVLGFFATIAISGTYGAYFAPATVADPGTDGGDCGERLERLFDELETTGQALMMHAHEQASEGEWKVFSDRFRARLTAIRQSCQVTEPDRAELALLADHLERHRLGYETALRSLRQIAGPSRAALVHSLREGGAAKP